MMANGAHRRVGTRLGLRDAVSPTFLCTAVLSATPTVAVSPCLALLAWLSIISGESQLARCAPRVLLARSRGDHVKTSAPGASRVAWTLSFLLVSGT
jgi:predicted Kef-type K+ transport protein